MKKLNKKGSTLIELIISITLISFILVFLMRLLVDLNNTQTNNDYAKDNQINRAEIIRMVENDLNNNTITNITNNSSSDKIGCTFSFSGNKEATISATSNKFTYTSSDGTKRSWTMDGCTIYTNKANVTYSGDSVNQIYALQIDIEVHTVNDNNKAGNNNLLDDILISYIGKYNDFKNSSNLSCLGYNY